MRCLCTSVEGYEEERNLAPDQEAIQEPQSDTETEHMYTYL